MRHASLVGLFLLLLTSCGGAAARGQSPAPRIDAIDATGEKLFAGVPWGVELPAIREGLGRQGFTFAETDEDGDHVFNGRLLGFPTRIYAFMGDDRLVKMQIVIITPDEDAVPTFADMREVLSGRYGEPVEVREQYDAPYRAGDGRAAEAIGEGLGQLALAYDGLWMEVTEQLVVSIHYESKAWPAERSRRQKAEASGIF